MKPIQFALLFLCFAISANAQEKPVSSIYVILKAGTSFLFTPTKKGLEQISFPYSVKPNGGTVSDSSFASTPFASLQSMQTAVEITLEIGNKNHFIQVNGGGFTSRNSSTFIALTYGRNFYLNIFGQHTHDPLQRSFVLKPSLQLLYNSYNNNIGSLDNLNKYLYIGSYTSGPTFDQTESDGDFSSTTNTYSTQNLSIAYLQRDFLITPQIAFGNNQYKHIFHWEIIAGAYFSLTEAIGVKFTQQASGDHNQASGFYQVGTNNIGATFNGKNITTPPFRLSGFKIGFNIGVSQSKMKKTKKK
jgi:hypothetical protein